MAPRPLVSIAILLLVRSTFCAVEGLDVTTNSSITVSSNQTEKTIPTTTAPKLCDVCTCTDSIVNCTKRGLEHHFHDSQWPTGPLEEVIFEENFLVHLKPFPNVTINRLILRGNRITKIDDKAFREIRNLTELDLSHNQLTSELLNLEVFEGKFAVEEYEPLAQLRVLNLGSNALHTLKQDVFAHVPDLRVLVLSGNPLTTIDQSTINAISQLLYLEDLDLSYCELTTIPDHIFHAPSHLRRLRLDGNKLAGPPSAFEDCKALEYLSLDENPFRQLDHIYAFSVMPALKELSLRSLPHLTSVGRGAFSQLTALQNLTLSNCPRLKAINEDALVDRTGEGAIWPPLKILDLSDNALQYLSSGLVGRWDHLEILDLRNNEWSCDYDNQFLIGNLLPHFGASLMGKELDSLKCAAPPEHAGKNLTSLANRTLRPLDTYGARPERDAAILVGVLIGVLLSVPVALSVFVFWRKGYFFCGSQGPASFSRAFYKRTSNDEEI